MFHRAQQRAGTGKLGPFCVSTPVWDSPFLNQLYIFLFKKIVHLTILFQAKWYAIPKAGQGLAMRWSHSTDMEESSRKPMCGTLQEPFLILLISPVPGTLDHLTAPGNIFSRTPVTLRRAQFHSFLEFCSARLLTPALGHPCWWGATTLP